jgi:hypothetical protein
MITSTCPPPEGGSSAGRTAALIGVSALASLFLAACGGDSDSPAQPPVAPPPPVAITQVPASAAVSDASLEAFAFNLPETENTEPLTLELVPVLPSSETEEPIATP